MYSNLELAVVVLLIILLVFYLHKGKNGNENENRIRNVNGNENESKNVNGNGNKNFKNQNKVRCIINDKLYNSNFQGSENNIIKNKTRDNFVGFFNKEEYPTIDIKIDGIKYNVLKDDNAEEAANILHKLNLDTMRVIKYMNEKYKWNPNNKSINVNLENNGNNFIQDILLRLNRDYNPNNLYEHIPNINNEFTAYTDNKGLKVAICLRNYERFHDYNTVLFVMLHEVSHIANKSYDHDKKFWHIFAQILNDANEAGIYNIIDYKNNPMEYCNYNTDVIKIKNNKNSSNMNPSIETFSKFNIDITYNPLLDDSFNSIIF